MFVKVVDGTLVDGNFWVFYGALTDIQYKVTVTDTKIEGTLHDPGQPVTPRQSPPAG